MTSTTKLLALPSSANRKLVNLLSPYYISEDFQHMSDAVAFSLNNPNAQNSVELAQALFKTINAVVLDNLFWYLHEQEHYHMATVLGHRNFVTHCRVRIKYLTPLTSVWGNVPDIYSDEAEARITHTLLSWLSNVYQQCHDQFNEALLNLYESMRIYTPYRLVRTYQFEIGGDLSPLMIYTDCIHETASVY